MKRRNLSYKITRGFLISFCLPLVAFMIVWMYQMVSMQKRTVENQVNNDLNGIVNEICYRVQEMEVTARSIATNQAVIDYLQNYSTNPTQYLLEAIGDFGSFIDSINQINPRIEEIRIYSMDEKIPRYQNKIYPKSVMNGQAWMEKVQELSYDEAFMGGSALLYEAQNSSNYQQLVFPVSTANPRVFSMYRQIYMENSVIPVGYLEVCISCDNLLGIADTLTEGVNVLFEEKGKGILYSLRPNPGMEEALMEWLQKGQQGDFRYQGQTYQLYEKTLREPAVTAYYIYPMALYNQTLYGGIGLVAAAIGVSACLMLIFVKTSFRMVPVRLNTLIERMKQVRMGSMEVEFRDEEADEISEVNQTLEQLLKHINSLINTVYRIELSEKEATLRFLRMQMDPHFLFNALEAIRMSAALGYYDKVEEALVALSDILRMRLRGDARCSIREEVEIAQKYVMVENLRYNERILIRIEMDEQLGEKEIPALTIQPLVNNAIRHGLTQNEGYLMIRLEIGQREDGGILIRVTDNGSGMNQERLDWVRDCMRDGKNLKENTEHGTGLVNLALRLRLNYGERADMQLDSIENGGTQVEIRIKD